MLSNRRMVCRIAARVVGSNSVLSAQPNRRENGYHGEVELGVSEPRQAPTSKWQHELPGQDQQSYLVCRAAWSFYVAAKGSASV